MTEICIKAGTWLTCKRGHRFARAKVDIERHAIMRIDDLEFIGEKPRSGEPVKKCFCGEERVESQGNDEFSSFIERPLP